MVTHLGERRVSFEECRFDKKNAGVKRLVTLHHSLRYKETGHRLAEEARDAFVRAEQQGLTTGLTNKMSERDIAQTMIS
jgi:hypothetical protein